MSKIFNCIIYVYSGNVVIEKGKALETKASAMPVICDAYDAESAKEAMMRYADEIYPNRSDSDQVSVGVVELDKEKLRALLDSADSEGESDKPELPEFIM